MGAAARGWLFRYGVHRAPVLVNDLPQLWAVDSFGNVRKARTIRPGDDEETLGERLWDWLLAHHPERKLALVREPPAAAAPGELVRASARSRRMIDARLVTDPRSPLARRAYMDRIVVNASRHVRRFRDT